MERFGAVRGHRICERYVAIRLSTALIAVLIGSVIAVLIGSVAIRK
jgi:hypothetical protein